MNKPPPDPVWSLKCPSGAVSSLGCLLLAEQPYLMAGSQTGLLHIWNPSDLKICLTTNVHASSCLLIAPWSVSDSSQPKLITQGRNEPIKLWQLTSSSLKLLQTFPSHHDAFCKAETDGEIIACPTRNAGELTIHTLDNSKIVLPSPVNVGSVMGLKLMPNRHLLAAYESGAIVTWDWANKKQMSETQLAHSHTPMCLDYDPTSGNVVVGTNANLHVLTLESLQLLTNSQRDIKLANPGISSLRFRADSKLFVCGGWDGRVRYFSNKSLKFLASLDFHQESVSSLLFLPPDSVLSALRKSKLLVAGSSDGWLSFWDLYN